MQAPLAIILDLLQPWSSCPQEGKARSACSNDTVIPKMDATSPLLPQTTTSWLTGFFYGDVALLEFTATSDQAKAGPRLDMRGW